MAVTERRLGALEQAVGISRRDLRDIVEMSTLDLALYLLECSITELSDAEAELGAQWKEANPEGASTLEGLSECYVASLIQEVIEAGANPLLLEQFRGKHPDRIFSAAQRSSPRWLT